MDKFDKAIVAALQDSGRLSMLELSETVGLSPTPCARRVKKLEQYGVITGYSAIVDEKKLGAGFSVFVSIKLDKQIDDALKTFEKAISNYPEVVNCWLMTGNRDYLMRVAVAGLEEFEAFLTSRLNKVPGVASIESSIPIRQVKTGFSRNIAKT